MKILISPESPVPIRVKAFFRWAVVKYHTTIRDRRYELHELDDGMKHGKWWGYLENNGMTIAYTDAESNLYYRW